MPPMRSMTLRLSSTQNRILEKLAEKLQIDKANVIRLAITRLAEQEGLSRGPK
jgi:predicted transcriptional regulator